MSYFFGTENKKEKLPFMSSKDIKKEDIPCEVSSKIEQYFNQTENKGKMLAVFCPDGFWTFENSGKKLSFTNIDKNIVIESYHIIDASSHNIKQCVYLMNNGSIIQVLFQNDRITFEFLNNYKVSNTNLKWIEI